MPGPRAGISPFDLAPEATSDVSLPPQWGVVQFVVNVITDTTGTSFKVFPSGAPFACRVVGLQGIMQGAGAGGMTLVLNDNAGNAITDSISLAALPDRAVFDAAAINDARWLVNKGDVLAVVTATSPLTYTSVILQRTET